MNGLHRCPRPAWQVGRRFRPPLKRDPGPSETHASGAGRSCGARPARASPPPKGTRRCRRRLSAELLHRAPARTSPVTPNSRRWIGAKSSAGIVDVYHLHQRVAARGEPCPAAALVLSHIDLAVASEWLPSPIANSIAGACRPARRNVAANRPADRPSACSALSTRTRRCAAPSTAWPATWPPPQHQLGFIQAAAEPSVRRGQRLDHRAIGVVDQHQDMRHLQRRATAAPRCAAPAARPSCPRWAGSELVDATLKS